MGAADMDRASRQKQPRTQKQQRSLQARQLRAAGCTWAEIALIFRQQYGVSARAALRLAHGWSQSEVAEEWNRRWPDAPLKTAKRISAWESWPASGHAPSFGALDKLAQLYQCEIADLLADLPGYEGTDPNCPRSASAPQVSDETELTLGAGTVEQLEASVQQLASGLCHAAGEQILNQAHQLQHQALKLMNGPSEGSRALQLPRLAAQLSTLLGWLATSLGQHAAADRHLRLAYRYAHQADDAETLAWVIATDARRAFYQNDPTASLQLAARAEGIAPAATDRAFVTLLEARASGGLGRADLCEEAIKRWRSLPSRHRNGSDHGPASNNRAVPHVTAAQQHYLAGSALLLAGSTEVASAELAEAISMFGSGASPHCYGAEIAARIDAASAHVELDDLDAAAEVLDTTLLGNTPRQLPHAIKADGLRRRLQTPRYQSSRPARRLLCRLPTP